MFKLYNDADIEKINVVCDRGRSLMYNMKVFKPAFIMKLFSFKTSSKYQPIKLFSIYY